MTVGGVTSGFVTVIVCEQEETQPLLLIVTVMVYEPAVVPLLTVTLEELEEPEMEAPLVLAERAQL